MLRQSGIEPVEPSSGDNRSMRDKILDYGLDTDIVVVGGGDGTLNAAVEGILQIDRPLGILPLGTANDLARTLQLPTDLSEAARVIVSGHSQRIDLGDVNGKPFFNVASMGISGDVARALDRDLKARLGILGYPLSLWRAATRRRVVKGTIRCDEASFPIRAIQISVGNGHFYGGGMAIASDARIDDGTLDLVIMAPQDLWRLVRRLPAFRWGRHDLIDQVSHLRGHHIEVTTSVPLPINTDGEMTTETPAVFKVLPKVLEVFIPKAVTQ